MRQTSTIVIASALSSRAEKDDSGFIETITTLSIEQVIKGRLTEETIDLVEPGGTIGEESVIFPGSPRFEDGERYLLFLMRSSHGWHVRDLVLGKFSFRTDVVGRRVLVRDENEIATPGVHKERRRSADAFVDFVRVAATGGPAQQDYDIDPQPLLAPLSPSTERTNRGLLPISQAAFSATSYMLDISGRGARWNVFPSPVTWTTVGTEPGAPNGGVDAVNVAFGAWNNDPNSNVNYVYAGPDVGTHTNGLSGTDGANTILWERNLTARGIAAFSCSANSYSGTLGVGGITSASGTHTGPNGETFFTTVEGDVEMNHGLANCTFLFSSGNFNSGVTHEVGHTLGFRHSDQNRASTGPCTGDATLECSSTAIMTAVVTNGINATLQPWDQHAVAAVYPGSGGVAPAAPTGVNAHATAPTQVLVTWTPSVGATSYQILRKAAGTGFVSVGTSTVASFTDNGAAANAAYLYIVRAVNATGSSADSAPDLATTVIFTDDPLTAGVTPIKAVHLAELRTAVNAVRALAGLAAATFTDAAVPGVVVKAVHVIELRTRLNEALAALGLAQLPADATIAAGQPIRATHFQTIRDRVK